MEPEFSATHDKWQERFERAVKEALGGLRLILDERPNLHQRGQLPAPAPASGAVLLVGPEGGWTDEEISAAAAAGFLEVSLGVNILRTETAVIAALAIVNYALGDSL